MVSRKATKGVSKVGHAHDVVVGAGPALGDAASRDAIVALAPAVLGEGARVLDGALDEVLLLVLLAHAVFACDGEW